jgi:polynucleotide 5'-triphosphatase
VDDKTGQVVECLEKSKLANLNVYSPNEEFDWRISVNSEVPCMCIRGGTVDRADTSACIAQVSPQETSTYARRKDRVSYKHSLFQIDLTQVSNPSNVSRSLST